VARFWSKRLRSTLVVLAIISLALQGFALARHSAALTGASAATAEFKVQLAALGFTDAEASAICHSQNGSDDTDTPRDGTKHCPICTSGVCKSVVMAVLADEPVAFPALASRDATVARGPPLASGLISDFPKARGPPPIA